MSLDKLIAAATEYLLTGADVHRRALAGGGGKITDLSEPAAKKVVAKTTKTGGTVDETATAEATAATKATKPTAAETPADEPATAAEAKAEPEDELDGPTISYEEDIRPVLRAKSLANRDALVALLAKFSVKSGQELTAAQYPAFLAGLKAI